MRIPAWSELPAPFRRLARWATIVQAVGYTTALALVYHTTRMVPSGVADRYRGVDPAADPDGAMQFPKPMEEMLRITHTHLLSMLVIFLISGLALTFCARVSARWKRILTVEPFIAILVSFGALWGTRFADPRFAYLLMLSSSLMAVTFYAQSYLVLREVGWRDPD